MKRIQQLILLASLMSLWLPLSSVLASESPSPDGFDLLWQAAWLQHSAENFRPVATAIFNGDKDRCAGAIYLYEQLEIYSPVNENLAPEWAALADGAQAATLTALSSVRDVYLLCVNNPTGSLSEHNYGKAIVGADQSIEQFNRIINAIAERFGIPQDQLDFLLEDLVSVPPPVPGSTPPLPPEPTTPQLPTFFEATINSVSLELTSTSPVRGSLLVEGEWPVDCAARASDETSVIVNVVIVDYFGMLAADSADCQAVPTPFTESVAIDLSGADTSSGLFHLLVGNEAGTIFLDDGSFITHQTDIAADGDECTLSGVVGATSNFCVNFGNGISICCGNSLIISNHVMAGGISPLDDENEPLSVMKFSLGRLGNQPMSRVTNALDAAGASYEQSSGMLGNAQATFLTYASQQASIDEVRLALVEHEGELYMLQFDVLAESLRGEVDDYWSSLITQVEFY